MSYLIHYGIKGQKWGIRRFQKDDGSLNKEGKRRYKAEIKSFKARHKNLMREYRQAKRSGDKEAASTIKKKIRENAKQKSYFESEVKAQKTLRVAENAIKRDSRLANYEFRRQSRYKMGALMFGTNLASGAVSQALMNRGKTFTAVAVSLAGNVGVGSYVGRKIRDYNAIDEFFDGRDIGKDIYGVEIIESEGSKRAFRD